jgi:6-phosphogluconate dehydrogenase (decarboxylating)
MELGFVELGRMGANRTARAMDPSALPVRDTARA